MFENKSALVVDDSTSIAQIVCQLLRNELKFGKTFSASNGQQGLAIFKTEQIDWIFSDFEMPHMNGLELLTAVRKLDKGGCVPFVIMTSHADKETFSKIISAGATDFIAKPFNPAIFIQKVQRIAVAGERRVAERVLLPPNGKGSIAFSDEITYGAEMVNLSSTGCMLRTKPFHQGGMIYDTTQIGFELDGKCVESKALLVRLEADRANAASKAMLAAFHFLELDDSSRQTIKEFLAAHNPPVPDQA